MPGRNCTGSGTFVKLMLPSGGLAEGPAFNPSVVERRVQKHLPFQIRLISGMRTLLVTSADVFSDILIRKRKASGGGEYGYHRPNNDGSTMMNKDIQQEMLSYYNERAGEHDLVYIGKGPAQQEYSEEYKRDVARISEMASGFGRGHGIDIACGTGFWTPHYAKNCRQITFVDQSECMLLECRKRVENLHLPTKTSFIQANFFDIELGVSTFDCALVGFLLSHFESEEEETFFRKLKKILNPLARLMIIDSSWSEKRKRLRQKSGIQERFLEDGRKYRVYKKYFEQSDIQDLLKRYDFALRDLHFGDMLFAAIVERER